MAEQRRLPRFKRRLNIRFQSAQGRERSAFTADVSRDGLYVSCAQPEQPGRLLELDVDLPGVGMVQVSGMVTWARRVPRELQAVRRGGFGVQIRLSPHEWSQFFDALHQPAQLPGASA